jgi:hypothetical protein
VEAFLLSRWVRILLITTGSSMHTMICTAPPQTGQVSMSMPNTRFSRCAQVFAREGYAGFAGAITGHRGTTFDQCWISLFLVSNPYFYSRLSNNSSACMWSPLGMHVFVSSDVDRRT